ncbi:MAG: nSTAND1 domain-containing NTPase, partial [Aeromicrobium sp.]
MAAIFISHSSRDDAVAADVRDWLATQGHRSLFLDFDPELGIPAGRVWEHELYRQLRACRAVIVLCSQASMASRWCFAEVTQASALGKVLLPVRIDDCTVDGVLSSRQVIDFRDNRVDGLARLRQGLLAAGVDPTERFDWDGSRPPYPGLLAFQEADAAVYFGRAREVGTGLDVLHRVRRLGSPGAVVVVGASGSGKSSLVRAGLVPRLRGDVDRWLVVDPFRPRDDPVAELAAVWSHAFTAAGEPRDIGDLTSRLRSAIGDPSAANPLTTWTGELRRAARRPEATVLVIADQLEELILTTSDAGAGVLRCLREATDGSGGALIVLATLRSDFLGVFQQHPEVTSMEYELVPVGSMSVADIAQVIEGPARVAGLDLEVGLVQAMVDDTDTEDALPLLAFTLRELHDHFGSDGVLEIDEYRQLGGLHGAVARVADELVESEHLTSDQEDQLRRAFLAMVRLTDDDRWVRQIARWDELPSAIQPVLENFVRSRLLVSAGDGATRTAEVSHEALFRSWDRLATWLRQDAEVFRLRRDLDYAANVWEAAGHQPSDLWRGGRLDRTAELTGNGVLHLSITSRAFINAALAARQAEIDSEQKSRRRRLQIAAAVTVGALLLAIVASTFFVRARRESDRAERQAQRSDALALAAQADAVATQNPALGLALAAEAARTTSRPLPRAVAALVSVRIAMADRRGQPVGQPLEGHIGRVTAVAFSRDGELVASAGLDDGTVRLWDPATGEPVG